MGLVTPSATDTASYSAETANDPKSVPKSNNYLSATRNQTSSLSLMNFPREKISLMTDLYLMRVVGDLASGVVALLCCKLLFSIRIVIRWAITCHRPIVLKE